MAIIIKSNNIGEYEKYKGTNNQVLNIIENTFKTAKRNPRYAELSLGNESSSWTPMDLRAWSDASTELYEQATSLVNTVTNATGNESYSNPAVALSVAYALALAQDPAKVAKNPVKNLMNSVSNESHHFLTPSIYTEQETQLRRGIGSEVFDEQSTSKLFDYQIALNMTAPIQNEFGSTWYPTVVGDPAAVGLDVAVGIPVLQSPDIFHDKTGAITEFKYINVLRTMADPSLLIADNTELIGVWRDDPATKEYFVDSTLVPPRPIKRNGSEFLTSYYKPGVAFNLLGICQTDAMLAKSIRDFTDTIHPAASLKSVLIKAGDDIIEVNVSDLMSSNYNGNWQGNQRGINLAFDTSQVILGPNTVDYLDADLVTLSSLKTNKLSVRLSINASGTLNVASGQNIVYFNRVALHSVFNEEGELASTDPLFLSLKTALASIEVIGYLTRNFATNINRRQIGTLVDTITYRQTYGVALRPPISAVRPETNDSQNEATDINTLVSTINTMTEREAVDSLFNYAATLKPLASSGMDTRDPDDARSIGGILIKPYYDDIILDLSKTVDSLNSHQRTLDIQASLLNTIKLVGYQMWIKTEFQAALNYYYPGSNVRPTILVAIDPIYASFLEGVTEVTTEGMQKFPIKVVSSLNKRFRDQMFISLSYGDEKKGEFQPLWRGFMAYFPEIVMVTNNTFRQGRVTKEITVHPRFQHFDHLPCLVHVKLSNLNTVLNKMNINVKIDDTGGSLTP